MRLSIPLLCILGACASPRASAPPQVAPKAEPAAPTVDRFLGLEVIGAHKVPVDQIIALLDPPPVGTAYPEGQNPLGPRFARVRDEVLAKRFPFAQCRFNFAGYPDHTFGVTVDWVDQGDEWRMRFDPAPTGHVPDPDGLLAAWGDYRSKLLAVRKRGELPWFNPDVEKPFGVCHGAIICWGGFGHPDLAPLEQKFIEGVPRHVEELLRVLREDADGDRRSGAATLLTYAPRDRLVKALLPSVRDPDAGVRNQVMQLLEGIQGQTDHVVVPLDPILDALWFPQVTDRNKAGWTLVRITELERGAHAKHIAEKAGPMLVDMAAAHQRTDSLPAQRVLKAISGEDHGGDAAAWRRWLERIQQ